eukprot:35717-Karenia_brevis.AAC.1
MESRLSGVNPSDVDRQGLLAAKLDKIRLDRLKDAAGDRDRARLNAAAAPRAGWWLGAPPNKVLGLKMSNAEINSRVGRRLGSAIAEEKPC